MATRKSPGSRKPSRPARSRGSAAPASRRAAAPTRRATARGTTARTATATRAPSTSRAGGAARSRAAAVVERTGPSISAGRSGGSAPSAIGLVRHHTDYTSHDMAAVQRFYVQVLGFTRTERNGEYVVVHTSEYSSLGFMPPMPVPPEQWRPPREPALYFMVEDVDRVVQRLREHGVAIEMGPMDTPWGHRFAAVLDPEGRRVCFAHPLRRAAAR